MEDDSRTVATADGIVNIVPHFMGQGLIDAMRDVGQIEPDFYGQYVRAGAKAMGKLTCGLTPPELLDYIGAAWKASGGNPDEGGRL